MMDDSKLFSPWPSNPLVRVAAFLWLLPYGLVGLVAALLFTVTLQARPRIVEGAIDLVVTGWLGRKLKARGWGAFTLSWTVFYWSVGLSLNPLIRKHERQHVRQAMVFGIFYPFVYLTYLLMYGYSGNIFELEAYAKQDKLTW